MNDKADATVFHSDTRHPNKERQRFSSPRPLAGEGSGERVLLSRAKTMRSQQTDAEQRLWFYLRAQRFMGLKFKRQKPIGAFIVDFICMELGLIVEADGGQHGDERDQQRDEWLKRQGFTVLHFWNNDILQHTENVLQEIWQVALTLSPNPSPASGREEERRARVDMRPDLFGDGEEDET